MFEADLQRCGDLLADGFETARWRAWLGEKRHRKLALVSEQRERLAAVIASRNRQGSAS
jgi:hypothetical protein